MANIKKASIPHINVVDSNLKGILQPMKERIEDHITQIDDLRTQLAILKAQVHAKSS